MAKRKLEDEGQVGYVSNISPIKLARNNKTRYFTADLQTAQDTTDRVVCFSPEKHEHFTKAGQSPHPFEIRHAKVQPGRDNNLDIKVFKDGELLKSARQLSFTKKVNNNEKDAPGTVLKDLKQYEMATVNVQVKIVAAPKTVQTKYGPRDVVNLIVADKTDTIQLSVWEPKQAFKETDFYQFTNVLPKIFDDTLQLNSTTSTLVKPITAFPDAKAYHPTRTVETISFESVQITKKHTCGVCFKQLDDFDNSGPLVKCNSCNFKQLKNKVTRNLEFVGYHHSKKDTVPKKINIDEETLSAFLKKQNNAALLNDPDECENFIMLNNPYKISLAMNKVVQIEKELK